MEYESFQVFKEPQCLIESSKDGKLKVVDDVLTQISQINEQLNVVAIAGLYRTGKSYLLNRLAKSKKGFLLGSTIEAMTKGIWAWCRPHPARKGEVLLLLDTEGLGDIKKGDSNHDSWILTLATLLASTLVYNIMGKFDQDALDKISFVTEMSKHVTISANKEEDDNFDVYFPLFILTVRDFSLDLEKAGKEITSDEYLEDCLHLRSETKSSDVKYNEPRKCIRKYFKNRKCFTFDSPGSKKICKKIESLTDEDLNEDVVAESNKFTTFVYGCSPKSLRNGQPVKGRMIASLILTYVTAIREGNIPCIQSALDAMAQSENSKAVEACVQLYVDQMTKTVKFPVLTGNGLSEAHHVCIKDALALFLKKAVYDQNHEYQTMANEKMNAEYEKFKTRNVHESEVKCKEALAQLNETIETKIKDHVYHRSGGYNLYQQDIKEIREKYNKKSDLGCKKEEIILKYIEEKWDEGQAILYGDQQVSLAEKEIESVKQKAIEAERQRKELELIAEERKKKLEDDERQYRENMEQFILKQKQETENEKKHNEELINKRLEEYERLVKEGHRRDADKLKSEMDGMRIQNEMLKTFLTLSVQQREEANKSGCMVM